MRDQIVQTLINKGGYKRVSGPLRIVDTDFGIDFDAVLVGPGQQGCLVLVVDGEKLEASVIQRRVRSFALVLDRSGSRRPLTVVLIAVQSRTFEGLERLCRVIIVAPDDDVDNAIRGLLPLRVHSHEQTINAAENALTAKLGPSIRSPLTASLIKSSQTSTASVEKEFLAIIDAAIGNLFPESGTRK